LASRLHFARSRHRLAAQGVAIDDFIGELKRLSDNQIATADLVLASNRALALGISSDDLPGLMTVAANAAVELGISTTQAFNDITTGIGRASPLILDNLGIVVDATKVYAAFADSIGVSVEELTKQQKTAALSEAVMKGATNAIEDFSTKQNELTRNLNRGRAAFDNMTSTAGRLGGALVQLGAAGLATTIGFALDGAEAFLKLGRAFIFVAQLVPGLNVALEGTATRLREMDDGIDGAQKKLRDMRDDLLSGGIAGAKFALGIDDGTEALKNNNRALDDNSNALGENKKKEDESTKAKQDAKDAAEEAGRATEEYTDSINGLAAAQALLKRQTEEATEAIEVQARITGAGPTTGGRIRIPGVHGSRLVDPAGFTTTPGTFTFQNGRRVQVFPDGTVVYP
jgi:hypothetical protein